MAEFTEAARLDEIPVGMAIVRRIGGKDLAIFNTVSGIFAIDDTCPHQGSSLGMGKIDGNVVTCRSHGMKFDVTTGCFAGTAATGVTSYPVKIVDGKVMVALQPGEKAD